MEVDTKPQKRLKLATEIFDKYGDTIRTMIYFHINDKSQTDDIFQDFFLSIMHKPVPPGIQNIRGYLYRAILNDVLDAARRAKNYRARIRRYAERRRCSRTQEYPQTAVIQAEEMQRLFDIVEKQLSTSEARAVTLRYRDNYNTAETAEKMGVNKRTVSRYVCVGLNKLGRFLSTDRGDKHARPQQRFDRQTTLHKYESFIP